MSAHDPGDCSVEGIASVGFRWQVACLGLKLDDIKLLICKSEVR